MSPTTSQKPLYKPAAIGLLLTFVAILVAMAAPLGNRNDLWGYGDAVTILKWAGGLGVVAILSCLSGLIFAWPGGKRRGFGYSLVGLAIVLPLVAFLYTWWDAKAHLPKIEDITTNPEDPLTFWDAPNSRIYDVDKNTSLQLKFYPDIKPLQLPVAADRAFELVVDLLEERGWTIWNPNPEELHVEATERTFWFGYSDDVSIQISEIDAQSSQVDMRSTSRYGGGGDGGTNAKRIRKFFRDLQARAE